MSSIPAAKERLAEWARVVIEEQFVDCDMIEATDVRAILADHSRLEDENANLKLDRDMWKGLAGKLDAQLAAARAERDEAIEALKPFAARIVDVGIDEDDSDWFSNSRTPYSQSISIKVGDVRRAASLIKGGADV